VNLMMGGLAEDAVRDWGLGGLLVMDDVQGKEGFRSAKKGTLTWGGMPNLVWWIDPTTEICGLYSSQILPPGDVKSVEFTALFEKTMYERCHKETSRL